MNKVIRRAGIVVFTIVFAVTCLTGCRAPKIGGQRDLPPPSLRPAGGGVGQGVDIDWPGTGEWEGLDTALTEGAGGMAANERRWEGVVVYFAYDRATIGAGERPKLDTLAQYLIERPNYYVVVEGHCDDRGSDEYNRALGERRALAVRDYLVALGIAETRVKTLSYGEEKPAVPDATTEAQHAQNRRAEFLLGIGQ